MATTKPRPRIIGELCVGGDWACAHGDFGALRYVAEQLRELERGPLHCELEAIAAACRAEPDRATQLWVEIRDRLNEQRGGGRPTS
jgi:hypothetical protein